MAKELPYPMWKIREPKHMAKSFVCQYPEKVVLEQKLVEQSPPQTEKIEIPEL